MYKVPSGKLYLMEGALILHLWFARSSKELKLLCLGESSMDQMEVGNLSSPYSIIICETV